jgi:hypothetical protein
MLDCFVAFAPRNDKKIPLLRHLCAGFYSRIPIGLLPKRSPDSSRSRNTRHFPKAHRRRHCVRAMPVSERAPLG